MTKLEFITRYGEDAWKQHLQHSREWYKEHKEEKNQQSKEYQKEHKEQHKLANRIWCEEQRIKGSTKYCMVNFELIENYKLAKADNFDPNKWHLHHRLENYWSSATLIHKGLYYNLNPEALIWLSADEHLSDRSLSITHPERSKWHKRILE